MVCFVLCLSIVCFNTSCLNSFITGRNEVVAKVIFLHLSLIHSVHGGGVCLSACWDTTPRTRQTPPQTRPMPPDQADPPQEQTPPGPGRPPQTRQTPPLDHADPPTPHTRQTPPPGSRLQHTVYERPVRILLECILVHI